MTGGDEPGAISERVVEAVADETGTDPLELDPLYRAVDPDCLDRIFRGDRSVAGRDARRLEFTFGGCRVIVSGDGSVAVSSVDDGSGASRDGGRSDGSSMAPGSPD